MKITVISETGEVQQHYIDKNIVILGRGQDCDVTVDSGHISREHLKIRVEDECIFIQDITLSNWVFYNEDKLGKTHETAYYDFALLKLPSNYEVKISLSHEEEEVEKKEPTKSNTQQKLDIYNVPGDNSQEIRIKRTRKKPKKLNEYIVVGFVLIIVIFAFFFVREDANNKQIVNDKPQNERVRSSKKAKRRAKNRTRKKIISKKSTGKFDTTKFEEMLNSTAKCKPGMSAQVCKRIFSNRRKSEGAIVEGATLYVLKEFMSRIRDLQVVNSQSRNNSSSRRRKQLNLSLLQHTDIIPFIAGADILKPSFLKAIENNNINNVVVFVFDVNKNLKGQFSIDSSMYRRFDVEDYDAIYTDISKGLTQFKRRLKKYVVEDKQ
ncbi:MAG: FHA domain-containing protein [Halobacteriovoraceae bacterium]|jgi:hypothetical protein|nr:FHA domain-containing protein [Halobacteriovoraceae bacterium]